MAAEPAPKRSAADKNASVKIPLEAYDYTLPNGMRVILDEDKNAPGPCTTAA